MKDIFSTISLRISTYLSLYNSFTLSHIHSSLYLTCRTLRAHKFSIKNDSSEISTANRWESSCISWSDSSNIIYRDNHLYRYVKYIVIIWMKAHEQVFLLRALQSTSCEVSQAQDIREIASNFIKRRRESQTIWRCSNCDSCCKKIACWEKLHHDSDN